MRGPQQGGCAEAEDENGDGQRDGGEQETDAGEHFGYDSAAADWPPGPWSQMETRLLLLELERPSFAAANQAPHEDTASAVQRLLKNVAAKGCKAP